jgi:hypothetical protein
MLGNAKLVGVEHLEMEEVNEAAKEIISKAVPKLWLYHWDLKVQYGHKRFL